MKNHVNFIHFQHFMAGHCCLSSLQQSFSKGRSKGHCFEDKHNVYLLRLVSSLHITGIWSFRDWSPTCTNKRDMLICSCNPNSQDSSYWELLQTLQDFLIICTGSDQNPWVNLLNLQSTKEYLHTLILWLQPYTLLTFHFKLSYCFSSKQKTGQIFHTFL